MVQPLYVRIQDELRELIASGNLGPGDRVPSEKNLPLATKQRAKLSGRLLPNCFEGLIDRTLALEPLSPHQRSRQDLNSRAPKLSRNKLKPPV
ncbi:MAG: hypothetical protein CM1200mP41_35010 [Gammaproteobacteria bacterium]|nr:MAG: hypothetical protein CM1200mP41_35010 [Gammaproteobacteria bacterium]